MASQSDVNTRSPYLLEQYSCNRLIRDLLDGLSAIRGFNCGVSCSGYTGESIYLPKFEKEPVPIYQQRLNRTYLTNYFLRTIQSDSGKILANPIKKNQQDGSELPDQYIDWLDDIDLEGKPFDVMARDDLQMAQAKGVVLAYVDYSADRPFVRQIDIDDVLSFKADKRTGRLTQLRWAASIVDDSDEEHVTTTNSIFEITPTTWAVYDEEDLDNPSDAGEIVRYRNGSDRITDELPVSIFYTNKKGQLLAESPYRGLAEMTIEHFQVNSDIKNMMFYALQPLLFGKGMPDGFKIDALASYIAVMVNESSADSSKVDLSWVQVDAAPIEQAREQIADIESRISAFGIDANGIRPSGNQTATQSAIDSAGSNAALKMFGSGLAQHLERVIEIMSSYTLQPLDVNVTVTPDFNVADNDKHAAAAKDAASIGAISKKAYTDVLINTGTLDKDFDFEQDQEQLRQEAEQDGLRM